jgi:hypothetical protein
MFYELYGCDTDNDEKIYYLVNLNEVLQVNKTSGVYEKRNLRTGQVEKYYRLTVYYTGKGNNWTFYYRSESERHLAYEELKKAMIEFKLLPPEKVNPTDASVILTNSIQDDFHPSEAWLRNSAPLDIPEVKLCE